MAWRNESCLYYLPTNLGEETQGEAIVGTRGQHKTMVLRPMNGTRLRLEAG